MPSLIEKKISSTCLYKGNSVSFYRDAILLPNKKKAFRDYMLHPGAVCVVAFRDKKSILMLKQYRYPVRRTITEVPAGKLDGQESPLACARRELLEETGFWPRKIKKFLSFWPTPAFATEVMHIFVAWDLEKRQTALDQDEFLEVFWMDFKEALQAVRSGEIKDAKSVISLLAIHAFELNPYL